MGTKEKLKEDITNAVNEWDDDFTVELEHDPDYDEGTTEYYNVTVSNRYFPGVEYGFMAMVSESGMCNMEFYEGCWESIDKGSLFSFMWFEEMQRAKERSAS